MIDMHRITGRVVRLDHKSGVKDQLDRDSGALVPREWALDIITILVAEQAVVEVTQFSPGNVPLPYVGQAVDYAVTVAARGGRVNVGLDKPWGDLFAPVGDQHADDLTL